jgi:hypothetical protein
MERDRGVQIIEKAKEMGAAMAGIANVEALKMPYHVEHGGIYLKDAAVLAGLGCIDGLLVTFSKG